MGIKPKFEDGKKRFKGINVSVRELVNIPIEVVDFETGIVPRFEREEYEKKLRKQRLCTMRLSQPMMAKSRLALSILMILRSRTDAMWCA